jgi:hypothetical protein
MAESSEYNLVQRSRCDKTSQSKSHSFTDEGGLYPCNGIKAVSRVLLGGNIEEVS